MYKRYIKRGIGIILSLAGLICEISGLWNILNRDRGIIGTIKKNIAFFKRCHGVGQPRSVVLCESGQI